MSGFVAMRAYWRAISGQVMKSVYAQGYPLAYDPSCDVVIFWRWYTYKVHTINFERYQQSQSQQEKLPWWYRKYPEEETILHV